MKDLLWSLVFTLGVIRCLTQELVGHPNGRVPPLYNFNHKGGHHGDKGHHGAGGREGGGVKLQSISNVTLTGSGTGCTHTTDYFTNRNTRFKMCTGQTVSANYKSFACACSSCLK